MMHLTDKVKAFLRDAEQFNETHAGEWSLDYNVEMETLNHLLRVWVQNGTSEKHLWLLLTLCDYQHVDGGWGDYRDERVSKVRTTAFSTQMLLRANRQLHHAKIAQSVTRGIDFLVAEQQPDGSWLDPMWPIWDATSVPIGTLIFVAKEPFGTAIQATALKRGMSFVIEKQKPDGGWYSSSASFPSDTTAHLLQKCLLYGTPDHVVVPAIQWLLNRQAQEGHWDKENIDHTCDAVRCLMLATSYPQGQPFLAQIADSTERAVRWLMDGVVNNGFGTHLGTAPNVLYTCDAIDTALKYIAFKEQLSKENMITFYR